MQANVIADETIDPTAPFAHYVDDSEGDEMVR